ncbi:cell death-inducing p53-target protein 1 homolog [Bolinopsis microptera]|uniref:cell death-inducing p53-target protein 1 homolog n=1 Tax=Bolinopsis microptera TaxID=2820187 RepID=UPI003078A9FF
MADQQGTTPPPPYEYPAGPYQAGTAPPPELQEYPTQVYAPGYGTDQSVSYPAQQYPVQQYPASPGYGNKEKTPLVGPPPHGVVQQNTIIIPAQNIVWGRHPIQTVCINCQNTILTEINYITGTFTWLIGGIIILIGGWFMCCIIPFFADSCKDVEHKCPHCHMHIHTWNRL